jgi:nucleoid DNA-binding protein
MVAPLDAVTTRAEFFKDWEKSKPFLAKEKSCALRLTLCGETLQSQPQSVVCGRGEKGSAVMTLTKRDLVIRIAEETGLIQQDVFAVLQKSLDYIVEALAKGNHVEFRNFGVFTIKTRKARIGRNPKKPLNTVTIPARKVVKFKPGRIMKKKVTG